MIINLRIGRLSPTLAHLLSFGYGRCSRCRTPWNFVHYHVTNYGRGSGCLPLCAKCWAELTPEGRLPFYREIIASWSWGDDRSFEEAWAKVEAAVMSGG